VRNARGRQEFGGDSALPDTFTSQRRFKDGEFAQQGLDRQVKSRDGVRAKLFGAQNIRRQAQGKSRLKPDFFGMPLQVHLKVHGIRGEMLEMRFELPYLLLKLFLELGVGAKPFSKKVPF